ncbi:hypothetical protein E5288_WYG013615 [Bos mutus]|uniref:Uncharacterized protein n=1 Tax=Bos mutus TaxID=72004 RepID=A0A6B0QQJ7_9CETA|nr:hypothetical protein [Bos mutus]
MAKGALHLAMQDPRELFVLTLQSKRFQVNVKKLRKRISKFTGWLNINGKRSVSLSSFTMEASLADGEPDRILMTAVPSFQVLKVQRLTSF